MPTVKLGDNARSTIRQRTRTCGNVWQNRNSAEVRNAERAVPKKLGTSRRNEGGGRLQGNNVCGGRLLRVFLTESGTRLVPLAHRWNCQNKQAKAASVFRENESSHYGRISNPALAVCARCAGCVCWPASGHLPSKDREDIQEVRFWQPQPTDAFGVIWKVLQHETIRISVLFFGSEP